MTEPLRIELIRGLRNLRGELGGCALTFGKFDGLHLGHQALLRSTREQAQRLGLPACVLSFDPTPNEFFAPGRAPPRLGMLRDKLLGLQAAGMQRLVSLRFDAALAALSPQEFLDQVLVQGLGARVLVVGDDLRFGRERAGDVGFLEARAATGGFTLLREGSVQVQGERCSSSAVRAALAAQDLARAERLLGRPYALSGRVRRGLQLGRKLGMPTANMTFRRPLALPFGVYAVRAQARTQRWNGVASFGVRPTLGGTPRLLETHLFDAAPDLYGEMLEVSFHHYLRPELRFDSLDALQQQMHQDAAQARALLAV